MAKAALKKVRLRVCHQGEKRNSPGSALGERGVRAERGPAEKGNRAGPRTPATHTQKKGDRAIPSPGGKIFFSCAGKKVAHQHWK